MAVVAFRAALWRKTVLSFVKRQSGLPALQWMPFPCVEDAVCKGDTELRTCS